MKNRNSLCKCGSGIKFKKCCGSAAKLSERRALDKAVLLERLRENAARREAANEEAKKSGGNYSPYYRRPLGVMTLLAAAMEADPKNFK